ncbi:hypothetical protein G9A89_005405 [Geosiphon pyriformis]|nr:hypothetical protein G9A89_005405 [Geosiphon pyriformis]
MSNFSFTQKKLTKQEWSSRNPTLVKPEFKNIRYLFGANERVDSQLLEEVNLIFPQLKIIIRDLLNHPSKLRIDEIVFSGHGLGGAYASIAALQWLIEKHIIIKKSIWPEINFLTFSQRIVTFGAPRVANKEFSLTLNKLIYHYRITHGNDHVPHFPMASMGWKHFGIEIWIEPSNTCDCPEDQNTYWDCNHSKLRTIRDWVTGKYPDENKECNAGQRIDEVPNQFFHYGPYCEIEMGNCKSFEGFKSPEDVLKKYNKAINRLYHF